MAETRRLLVTGTVQGVGFRAWTEATAGALGLDGWVRNRHDGSVEIVAKGQVAALEALAARCQEGPRFARVMAVDVAPADDPVAPGFAQRPTA